MAKDGFLKRIKFVETKYAKKNRSTYSIVSLSEVTEGAVQVWRTLPEIIKQDPSLASFRQEHERLHGKCCCSLHFFECCILQWLVKFLLGFFLEMMLKIIQQAIV